jgi:hypothetical protein
MHYSNEIWEWIPECEGRYMVSNFGRIRKHFINHKGPNSSTGQIIEFNPNDYGYKARAIKVVREGKDKVKMFKVHRLVGVLFVANPNDYPMINHLDGDKLNNHYANLEWTTAVANVNHAINAGLRPRSHAQVLNDEKVRAIRKEYDDTMITMEELSVKYNTTIQTINNCLRYITYFAVDPQLRLTYKINKLSKTDFIRNVKPIDSMHVSVKKTTKEHIGLTDEKLEELVMEFVNDYVDISDFTSKHNIPKKYFRKHLSTIDKLPLKRLDNETFKKYGGVYISNMGRIFHTKLKRLIQTYRARPTHKLVAELFLVKEERGSKLIFIDGDRNNVTVDNLKWIPYKRPIIKAMGIDDVPKDTQEEIKDKYLTTKLTPREISLEFKITQSVTAQILRGVKRNVKRKVTIPKEQAPLIRYMYYYKLMTVNDILKELKLSIAPVRQIILNEQYKISDEDQQTHIDNKKNAKSEIAREKVEERSRTAREATRKKKEAKKKKEEEIKKLTPSKKEQRILNEEARLISIGRPLTKICHACFTEKSTVRQFNLSSNLWDNRGSRCKECHKNKILIPEIYNMDLPHDHPLVIIDNELEKDYRRQQKIIEAEKKVRQEEHLKNISEKFKKNF